MEEYRDRRTERRKKVMAFTLVYTREENTLLGYLGDVSMRGMLVVGERPMEVNTNTTLVVKLPDDLPGTTDKEMVIPARVARCIEGDNVQEYQVGFEFAAVTEAHKKIIEALLGRYHDKYNLSNE
ncbi:MAG: PilZ domain-containing protein [Anaerolineales bacterium]|nr:PilZ domain-containing protein [Anaerolineales bacterium]